VVPILNSGGVAGTFRDLDFAGLEKKKRRAGTRKNQNNQTNNDDRQYGGSACDPAPGAMVVPMGGRHLAGGGVLAA
jgi:hypothetical protein